MNVIHDTAHDYVERAHAIGRSLEAWFDENGLREMLADMRERELFVAVENEDVTGFLVCALKDDVGEVLHLGVRVERQREGVGQKLLEVVEAFLKYKGARRLEVKTLAREAGYEPYERTHRFYERNGFVLREVITSYPGWSPGNPCAVYEKQLRRDID